MFAHVQPNGFCEAICDDYKYLRNCVICGKTCEIYLRKPGLEVIKLEYILRLKIKRNDWLIADPCPQSANHCALF